MRTRAGRRRDGGEREREPPSARLGVRAFVCAFVCVTLEGRESLYGLCIGLLYDELGALTVGGECEHGG